MTDIKQLIERLREIARKRSREHATTLPDDFNEWVAADALEAQAAEIAELRAEIAGLRKTIGGWIDELQERDA